MHIRTRLQLAEALGPVNRWFCSQLYGRDVQEPELLMRHYIRSGGAADFARRYDHAMSNDNRWFCAQHHRRSICDPKVLWDYYMVMAFGPGGSEDSDAGGGGLSIAC